jgi:hypothetical protein
MHKLWRSIGSPRRGVINSARLNAKLQYKKAIKEAADKSKKTGSHHLASSLQNKDFNGFWKIWNDKFNNKNIFVAPVGGFTNSSEIANAFRDYYSKTFINSADDHKAVNDYTNILSDIYNCDLPSPAVEIDVIERCIAKLKLNKAAGHDQLVSEHIVYSHPAIVTHLKLLFTMILNYSFVPDEFGVGVIVPVVKDRHGELSSTDNYRPITLSPVISKIFENFLIENYPPYLCTDDLQFGFKKHLSCSHPVFC